MIEYDTDTKTESFTFGIAWIDDVEWDGPADENSDRRDSETWYGADPSIPL